MKGPGPVLSRETCSEVASLALALLHAAEAAEADYGPDTVGGVLDRLVPLWRMGGTHGPPEIPPEVLAEVLSRAGSLRGAARALGIPKSTLADRLKVARL